MADRTELLEAALNTHPEGIALLDLEDTVVFWNDAAEAITGHAGVDLVGRLVPEKLKPLLERYAPLMDAETDSDPRSVRGSPVHARHKLGHDVPAMARVLVLRDGLGGRIGTAIVFHPTESLDALPHGETGETEGVKVSQADLKERLEAEFEDFARGGETFGVLWITVDQAHDLRKTHGVKACDTMLEKVAQALARGLRPTEKMGRWGEDEFLVISHERTPGDAGSSCAGAGRAGPYGGLSLVGRPGIAHREHRRSPGGSDRHSGGSAGKSESRNVFELSCGRKSDNIRAGGASMFAIIGIVLVFASIIGGFLMEKGHILVLLQPAELLIIAGAATGTLLVANPLHIIKGVASGLLGVLKGSPFGKARYLNTLKMMYQFLNKVRKEGLLSVEMDVEKPEESSIFKNYPEFLGDHHARDFVCDTLRTAITGGVEPVRHGPDDGAGHGSASPAAPCSR